MALGKLPVPGRSIIWMIVGQGPPALAVGAGGGCLDIFTLIYHFSPFPENHALACDAFTSLLALTLHPICFNIHTFTILHHTIIL